ncbi:MAG TPA: hypothetical protein VG435_05745 [Acidimicrobiales bacterium]|jgi:hypothetical protein|nr:hypothetical protein [Acidimicrobiales bacterium]
MGKASSSKKVARAAGIGGGRAHRRRTPWAYYGIIALIVVLGVVGTITSRTQRNNSINSAGDTDPAVGTTTEFEGYAVDLCGKISYVPTKGQPTKGITTTTEGVIYINPTTKSEAGKNATLGKFASTVGMKLNAAEVQIPGGHLYLNGDSCEGAAGHVYVKEFQSTTDTAGELYNGDTKHHQFAKLDPPDIRLASGKMLTIAFLPASKESSIPAPPASVISSLSGALQAAQSTSTTLPATSATTLPSTATTLPSTATTAPAATTATTQPSTATTKPSTSSTTKAAANQ